MDFLISILCTSIALQHFAFLVLEMFYWNKPLGLKIFGTDKKRADQSVSLAANQGLYNGFLAAGLIWALYHPNPIFSMQLKLFFLSCVFVAGLYGAYSVSKKILIVQAMPALITLSLLLLFN